MAEKIQEREDDQISGIIKRARRNGTDISNNGELAWEDYAALMKDILVSDAYNGGKSGYADIAELYPTEKRDMSPYGRTEGNRFNRNIKTGEDFPINYKEDFRKGLADDESNEYRQTYSDFFKNKYRYDRNVPIADYSNNSAEDKDAYREAYADTIKRKYRYK